ncbi:MAG: hypothetical protein AAGF74_18185 [Pseudomonadota bacterium]
MTLIVRLHPVSRIAASALLTLSLVIWSIAPLASHAPQVIDTIEEHLAMIADHGHSHGFYEDMLWAVHGHSHDAADHDHAQAVLALNSHTAVTVMRRDIWRRAEFSGVSPPRFRIDRPPRV